MKSASLVYASQRSPATAWRLKASAQDSRNWRVVPAAVSPCRSRDSPLSMQVQRWLTASSVTGPASRVGCLGYDKARQPTLDAGPVTDEAVSQRWFFGIE